MGGTDYNIEAIRNALGNPDGCEIDYEVEEVEFYTISPKVGQEKLHINSSIDIFKIKHFNLWFKECIFENKTLFKDVEFQKYTRFQQEILFDTCHFNKTVDFSDTTFNKSICFIKSTFEKDVYFKKVTFDEGISFCNSTSKGCVEFSYSTFNDMADFSGTIFKQKAVFQKSLFKKKAIFDDVKFGAESRNTYVSFSDAIFKSESVFLRTHFQYEADFQGSHFEDILDFEDAKFFDKAMFEKAQFKKDVRFSKSIFKQDASFKNIIFCGNANFNNAKFQTEDDSKGIADFSGSRFKERAFFSESAFKNKADFKEVIFDHNAYFDGAKFEKEANFSQAEFYKNAHFYGTKFEKFPNFIQAIIEGSINFARVLLDFSYSDIRDAIEQLYIQNNKTIKKLQIIDNIFHFVGDIKSSLLEKHNTLEASKYQKIELYCKELELEYKKKEEPQNSGIRDFVDKIQLYCYRVTSDHHTDLLLILNNIIFLIVLFGLISLGLEMYFVDNYFEKMIAKIDEGVSETLISGTILTLLIVCFMFDSDKKINFYIISIATCTTIVCTYFPLLAFVVISLCCIVLLLLILFACILHCLFKMCALEIKRYAFIFSYPLATTILTFNPKQLMPILGELIDDEDSKCCCCIDEFDILGIFNTPSFASETLNLIYMLFLFLLLWSLQKTARKNTIVPS